MRCILAVFLAGSCATGAEPLKLVASFGTAKVVGSGGFLVSPDGKTVVIGDRWFDFESGTRIAPPFELPEKASWHALLADGAVVVSHEEKLHFHPPKQTKAAFALAATRYAAKVSANGKTAAGVSQEEDKSWTLQVALPGKGVWKPVFKNFQGSQSWELSADGSRIVALEPEKKRLTVHTVATNKSATLDTSDEKYRGLGRPNISADGTKVVLHDDKSWKVFDAAKLELLHDIPTPDGLGDIHAGKFTPDGKYLIGFDNEHHWITIPLGEEKPAVRVHRFTGLEFGAFDSHLITRPSDGRQLLFTEDAGVVRLYDAATGKRLDTHSDVTHGYSGQLVIDDRRALAWGYRGRYVIWDTVTGKELRRGQVPVSGEWFDTPHWQANVAKGTLAVSLGTGTVHIRLDDGKPVTKGDPSGFREERIRFHPDGRTLIHVTEDEETDHPRTVIRDADTGKFVGAVKATDTDSRFARIHFHANGRTAVTADSGVVSLHELATGAKRWTKQIPGPWGNVQLNRTGDRLTYVARSEIAQLDGRTGRVMQTFRRDERPIRGKFGPPEREVVSADGRWLLDVPLTDHPERLHLYDFEEDYPAKRRLELTLPELGLLVGIDFTPDWKRLVTSYQSGICRVWDVSKFTSREPRGTTLEREAAKKWDVLAGDDAEAAGELMAVLIRSPKLALAVIGAHLPPPPVDPKLVAQRIGELGDKDFRVRDNATKALTAVAHRIDDELAAALAAGPSPEAADRLKKLLALARTNEPIPEVVRTLRALEVLEALGTPEATAFVSKLAAGPPDARLTRLAKESLARLRR